MQQHPHRNLISTPMLRLLALAKRHGLGRALTPRHRIADVIRQEQEPSPERSGSSSPDPRRSRAMRSRTTFAKGYKLPRALATSLPLALLITPGCGGVDDAADLS